MAGGRVWQQWEVEIFRTDGRSAKVIGAYLGRTERAVWVKRNKLKKEGVTLRATESDDVGTKRS